MNQCKKGFKQTPFCNMNKGFQRNYHPSSTQKTQGGNKPVNLGFKKIADGPREQLKCWECGEPILQRNCPRLNIENRTVVHNLQESTTVGDMGKYIHRINVSLEGRQVDHQYIVVEIEGMIKNKQVSILIDPWKSLSYITPSLVESCKLKKVKHPKSWLVQLAAGTKKKSIRIYFYV